MHPSQKLSCALAVASAAGLLAAAPSLADTLFFSGDYLGSVSSVQDVTGGQHNAITATSANASYGLDQFYEEYSLTIVGSSYTLTPNTSDPFTLTGAGGSSLFGTVTSFPGNDFVSGQEQQFTETLDITGGTQQFLGATGNINLAGTANYAGQNAKIHATGTIVTPNAVPEPGSLSLLGPGLGGVLLAVRRWRRA